MNTENIHVDGCLRLILTVLLEAVEARDVKFLKSKGAENLINYIPDGELDSVLNIKDNPMTAREICDIIIENNKLVGGV